jgi:DNA-binding transcriptional regulator PaaX
MSLVQEILKIVSDYPGGYGLIYKILYENGAQRSKLNDASVRNTLSRMKKKGLLSNKNSRWQLTPLGKEMLLQKKNAIISFAPEKLKEKRVKNTIVVFDIPETKRKYRDWLRHELICFGFELVQKSVWFGPSLPEEFIEYLHDIKLLPYIKFFHATESDLI